LSRTINRFRAAAWLALGTFVGAGAHAHHSFAVHFEPDASLSLSGVVTDFRFRNPHGLLFFTVQGEDGVEEEWKAETNSPNILRRRGWSDSSIKVGDRVTVEGYPSRDDSNSMRISRVVYEDGRELIGQRPAPGGAVDDD
jgi:hypothetical protein